MTVRLHLYRIRVVDVLVDLPERLEVLVGDLRPVVRCFSPLQPCHQRQAGGCE
jgi:hypothetical protein